MQLALAISIALGTLLSEDAATVAAGWLAVEGKLHLLIAYAAAVVGIWAGDVGLYWAARGFRKTPWVARLLHHQQAHHKLERAEAAFRAKATAALIICRFVPGTRTATYLTAGTLRFGFTRFAIITGVCAFIWVALVFSAIFILGETFRLYEAARQIAVAALLTLLLFVAWRKRQQIKRFLQRYARWEFWPPWLFYPPVAVYCIWLGIRFRGFSLPTIANPCIPNGGIVGETKLELLQQLTSAAPGNTADAYLIPPGQIGERMQVLDRILAESNLGLPFVLKPDVAQRGAGFKVVRSIRDVEEHLRQIPAALLVQRYAPGPEEAGIFYYRFPDETQGHILAITRKVFPHLVGDGSSTIEELVKADSRASLIAETYLQRLQRDRVPVVGEQVKLVEAGNHCQGCIFEDGADLDSPELLAHIHRISSALPGFYIGRYDIRYRDTEALRRGEFVIVELNGASSEATSIYDARNSLWAAYRMLFRQWWLVYAIGAANRKRGLKATTALQVWREWMNYRKQAACYPAAD